MPFIDAERRKVVFTGDDAQTKGELTYVVYKHAKGYLRHKRANYQNISDTIAALEDAAFQLRVDVLAPYEEQKKLQNGDI